MLLSHFPLPPSGFAAFPLALSVGGGGELCFNRATAFVSKLSEVLWSERERERSSYTLELVAEKLLKKWLVSRLTSECELICITSLSVLTQNLIPEMNE